MKSLMIVQHGDFHDDYTRLGAGGAETYRDQRRSVDFVAALAPAMAVTNVAICGRDYDVELAPGLRALGLAQRERLTVPFVRQLLDRVQPDAVLLRTPHLPLLQEINRRNINLLPCFADIFTAGGVRNRLYNWRLGRALMDPNVVFIANHSLNASRSLATVLGIPADRIVPWDWGRLAMSGPPKPGLHDPDHPRLFFAGVLTEDKGVGDCLDAIKLLKDQGRRVTMSFCGKGETAPWIDRARALGIEDETRIIGMIPNEQVRAEMRAHDMVIVPSRLSFAEGLPNTIYEGLASGSALLVSDHPAFAGRLKPDSECLVFKAADPKSLAEAILRLATDPPLYATLTARAEAALGGLYIGMDWTDMIATFLADPRNRGHWVERNALGNYIN